MYTQEQVKTAVKNKGYAWFDSNSDYDLNIVGIRSSSTGKKVTNLFDDFLTVSYKYKGISQFQIWPITTDPGTKSVKEFTNLNGVARLVPNQYRSAYGVGLHQGKYEALRQNSPVKVYRDKNKDMKYDENSIQEGMFGINIHKAGLDSNIVDGWSAGCQVFKRKLDFDKFMNICREAAKVHGNKFTYTLIESSDIK